MSNYPSEYGTFNIFHKLKLKYTNVSSIRNSCYTGFKLNNNIPSFVHGNLPVYSKKNNSNTIRTSIISNSLFTNQVYRVQDNFKKKNYHSVELFLSNPTNSIVTLKFNKKKYEIRKYGCILLDATGIEDIQLISNCYYLRPIVFKFKNNFMDVHHG